MTTLSAEALDAFEDALRAAGVALADTLRPPATPETLERLEQSLGFPLPAELRTWWSWHDGAGESGERCAEAELPPNGLRLLSTAESIEVREWFRQLAPQAAEDAPPPRDDPDYLFDPRWVPLLGTPRPAVVVADCSSGGTNARILYVDWANPEVANPQAESLGHLVAWLTEAWRNNVWVFRYDWEWETDRERAPKDPETPTIFF
jgi:cell wall assembly regulator SMI1